MVLSIQYNAWLEEVLNSISYNESIENDKVISYLMFSDQSTDDWIWLNDTEKRQKECAYFVQRRESHVLISAYMCALGAMCVHLY